MQVIQDKLISAWKKLIKSSNFNNIADLIANKYLLIFLGVVVCLFSVGFCFVSYDYNQTDIMIHLVVSIWLVIISNGLLKRIEDVKKRVLLFVVVIVACTDFLGKDFVFYNFTLYTYIGFVLFVSDLFFVFVVKKEEIVVLLSMIGQILDCHFLFFYLPFLIWILLYVDNNLIQKEKKQLSFILVISTIFMFILSYRLGLYVFIWDVKVKTLMRLVGHLIFAYFFIYYYYLLKKNQEKVINKRTIALFAPFVINYIFMFFTMYDFMVKGLTIFYLLLDFIFLNENTLEEHIQIFLNNVKLFLKIIFVFCIVTAIYNFGYIFMNHLYDENVLVAHIVNYQDFGFVQRGFIGQIVRWICGYHVTKFELETLIRGFYVVSLALVLLLVAKLTGNIFAKDKQTDDDYVKYVFVMMFIGSTALNNFFCQGNVFRFDLYNFLLAFICFYLLVINRFLFFIPVLCCIAVSIHSVFVFILFPLIMMCFIVRVFINADGRVVNNAVWCIITVASVGGLFLYYQLFSAPTEIVTSAEAYAYVIDRTNGFIPSNYKVGTYEILDNLWYVNIDEHLNQYQNRITPQMIRGLISFIIQIIPLLVVYFYAFFLSAKNEDNKLKKTIYRLVPFLIFVIVPCYIWEIDYGRWNAHILIMLIMAMLFLTIVQKDEEKWYKKMSKKYLYSGLLVVLLVALRLPLLGY